MIPAELRPRRLTDDGVSRAQTFRLLVMTPFPLRLDSPHGGRVSALLTLRLAQRHRIAVVCLRGKDEPGTDDAIRHACESVEEVERPESRSDSRWRRRFAQLGKLGGGAPERVGRSQVPAYVDRLRTVEADFRPDVVQVEPHEMAQYLRILTGPVKRVLVDHDPGRDAARDYSLAEAGLRRLWGRLEQVAWHRYANRTAREIDAVVVFNDRDRRSVAAYAGSKPIAVIPFHVPVPEQALNSRVEPGRILFFGGYDHPPNADAARRLVHSILPCVRRRLRSATLELVGETPERIGPLTGDGVVVTGRVASVDPHLASAALVAIPIRLGGGMRLKALESLAAGKAVVASARAIEGLDLVPGRDLLLAESDEDFCAAISGLLADDRRRRELGAAARRWAVANLDPDRAVEAYEALYRRLVGAGR